MKSVLYQVPKEEDQTFLARSALSKINRIMSIASKVNILFWEMDTLERKIRQDSAVKPKFVEDMKRLKYEVNRLNWDAHHLDEAIRTARFRTNNFEPLKINVHKRMCDLRSAIGLAKSQMTYYANYANPPASIFSPSNNSAAAATSSEGAGYSTLGTFGSPQPDSQESESFSSNYDESQNLTQSGFTGSGHYSRSESRSSQGSFSSSTSTLSSQNSQMYFGLTQNEPQAQPQENFSPDSSPEAKRVFFQL